MFRLAVAELFRALMINRPHVTFKDMRWNVRHVEACKDHVSCLFFPILGRRIGRACAAVAIEHSCSFLPVQSHVQPSGFSLPGLGSHVARFQAGLWRGYYNTLMTGRRCGTTPHFSVRTLIVLMLDASVRRSDEGFA
jgi:hypothetical protein